MDNLEFKNLRLKLGLTQLALANELDVSSNTVARIERGDWPVRRVIELSMLYLDSIGSLQSNVSCQVKNITPDLNQLELVIPEPLPFKSEPFKSKTDPEWPSFMNTGHIPTIEERCERDSDFKNKITRKRELALKKQAQFDAIKKS